MLSNIGAVQAQSKENQECNIEMETISIVLNCYRRTRWFAEQLNAIKNQSIKPIEILVWKNYSPNESISSELTKDLTVVDCNKNLGVWARFSLALNCKGKYICIFDDDTIPGKDWLKNGATVNDCVYLVKKLKKEGLDYVCVSSGGILSKTNMVFKPGYQVHLAKEIKKRTGIITRTTGLITEFQQAKKIIDNGSADIINMARKFINDPSWLINTIKKKTGSAPTPNQYKRCF